MLDKYDVVIGLEIHAQLNTESKCFNSASADFTQGHNNHITEVCAALPGTLPSLNQRAVDMAIRTGLIFHCHLNSPSVFARKQYFYPDMPKGYQISQYDLPIASEGYVEFYLGEEKRRIHLERAHMEEDAGKSTHFGEFSLINVNRAGIPLMEIVSKPEITSPQEAAAYARMVRQNLRYADICDGNLEEGSLRCDCNISLKPKGAKELGTKVELKNINSFRFIEKALEYEIRRQAQMLEMGEEIVQETRLYDSVKNKTFSMRKKEEAQDYRYFPEPDLMPLILEPSWVEAQKSDLPEMPLERLNRYLETYQLNLENGQLIVSEKELADYFEKVCQHHGDAKTVANWVTGEFLRLVNETEGFSWLSPPISPKNFGELLNKVEDKTISGKMAKEVFAEMWTTQKPPQQVIDEKGLSQISDESEIKKFVDKVIQNNADKVAEYKSGKDKLYGFFVGQIMKLSKGQANPELVNKLLREALK